MQISYNWLQEYLPKQIPLDKLSEILTSIGLEVEAVEKAEAVKGSLEGLVIGAVLTCTPHPNADKLKQTTVNIGNNTILPIVCGAPNVAAGQKVIVAPVGTTVYPVHAEPFEIKKAKIRGELSEGMICAEDEIGLGESHAGIMVLPDTAVTGMPADKYFEIPEPDHTIHIGLTPNRSDAMSHIGVARDISAYLAHHENLPLQEILDARSKYHNPNWNNDVKNQLPLEIKIDAKEACPRYAGVVISNVKVDVSPEWLQQRLSAIGLRSINNIVDITNYVLYEYGQPLHAFDYDKISGKKIIVKFAENNESFITLDGTERKLRGDDLMICNAEKPMCIAGVFGGKDSGVGEQTKNIFLESAFFDPKTIRRTSLHHQLRTDAAAHFEKTVDINNVIPALKRAAALIREIAGGSLASDVIEVYPQPLAQTDITFRYDYINMLCGKDYAKEDVDNILLALGFSLKDSNADTATVIVPSNKADVQLPADIAEEILRIDGLNNVVIPTRLNISLQSKQELPGRKWRKIASEYLSGKGFREIVTNSITNSKYYPGNDKLVKMINSLSSELDTMRPSMLESGLEVIAYNANRKQQNLALYETGNIYSLQGKEDYKQQAQLAIWLSGNVQEQGWQQPARPSDLYYLKGIVESLLQCCGIKCLETAEDGQVVWKRGKEIIGKAYQVQKQTLRSFDIKQAVYYAGLDMETLALAAEQNRIRYAELPKFPAVTRDLALVLDKNIAYDKIAKTTQAQKIATLRNFELFDVFEGEKIGPGKKSLALSFTFQLYDRTLTDEAVEAMMQQLISAYRKELDAEVRS